MFVNSVFVNSVFVNSVFVNSVFVNSVYNSLLVGYNSSIKEMEREKVQEEKPHKKTDKELWDFIAKKIERGDYIFLSHARKRLRDRNITDIDVLNILENKNDRRRKRNKSKDTYISGYKDWNYCIEGIDLDKRKIRAIISFNSESILIITVIRIDD